MPAVPDRRAVLAAIRGRIDPAPVPFPYRLALAGVALAMVLLPLVYLALVGTAAYATWWHAVHHLTWLAGRGSARGRMFVYATPIVGGLTTVFFMIKPLLAGHAPKRQPSSSTAGRSRFLFDFVDRRWARGRSGQVARLSPVRPDRGRLARPDAGDRRQSAPSAASVRLQGSRGCRLGAGSEAPEA